MGFHRAILVSRFGFRLHPKNEVAATTPWMGSLGWATGLSIIPGASVHPLQTRTLAFNIPVRLTAQAAGWTEGGVKVNLVLDESTAVAAARSDARGPEGACSLDNYLALPDHTMDERIASARKRLGATTILLGHHYQRDEVIRFADFTGDSYKLSKIAAETAAQYIVFCGVHFMAESADVLGRPEGPGQPAQQVILPDLNAGCSMADMAEISQVEACWEALERIGLTEGLVPLTYMNSTAAIKAFCGERGGLVCTSSNARAAFEWAFARGRRILFLPDQHLGRNTGFAMGIPLEEMPVWDPWGLQGGQTKSTLEQGRILLWKGHCAVHQRFLPGHVDQVRAKSNT